MNIPPRLSANGEWGYPIAEDADRWRVHVDGEAYRGVVAYDIPEGWADVQAHDDDGRCEPGVLRRYFGQVKVFLV